MLKKSLRLLSTLLLISLSTSVQARPVTIEFTATVDFVDDYGNALNGEVAAGQTITGSYSFDTNLADTDPYPESAFYTYPAPIPPDVGFKLNIGTLTFTQSPNTSSEFNLHIYNAAGGGDSFGAMTCCGNAGNFSTGAVVSDIYLDLYSAGIDAIATTSLDGAVSAVDKFLHKMLGVYGTDNNGNWYSINAQVTSISETGKTDSCDSPKVVDGTLGFKARIVDVYEASPTHPTSFKVGDIISGAYNFDPALPDMDPSPEYGHFEHPAGDPLGSISLNISGSTASSDPLMTWINIFIYNSAANIGSDHFHIMSGNSGIQLADGSVIQDIGLDLHDPSGTAITSASLSEGIPSNIVDFQNRDLFFYGTKPDGTYFHINAVLEEITNSILIDQPSSPAHVSPGSGPLVMYQKFDAGIVIDSGYEPISFIDATITDMYGGNTNVNCNPGPMSQDGRQTVICPDVTRSISQGNNTFSAVIHFINGNQISTATNWEVVGY